MASNDLVAQPASGTPKKRRRSTTGALGEVVVLDAIQQVHLQAERLEVTLKGFVLAVDGDVQTRRGGGKGGKEVGGFILGDQTCLVQVTLWGDAAKKHHPKLGEWLDQAEENKVPYIELSVCQVARFKSPSAKELRRLQSTVRTDIKLLGAHSIVVTPTASILTENAVDLMTAPLVSCFQGAITRVENVTHTLEDVALREVGITMKNGFEVPVMLYAIQAEEPVEQGDAVVVWFGEHRPPLANREGSKGMVWLYASGYLLNIGRVEGTARGRPLNIDAVVTDIPEEEEEENFH